MVFSVQLVEVSPAQLVVLVVIVDCQL